MLHTATPTNLSLGWIYIGLAYGACEFYWTKCHPLLKIWTQLAEWSPSWEAKSCSAVQEIFYLITITKFHPRFHKGHKIRGISDSVLFQNIVVPWPARNLPPVVEHENSLLRLQEHATGPYPLHIYQVNLHILLFKYDTPFYASISQTASSLRVPYTEIFYVFLTSHAYYMNFLSHPILFYSCNDILWRVSILKLLNISFSRNYCYFVPK
jgi:hypothetical protein